LLGKYYALRKNWHFWGAGRGGENLPFLYPLYLNVEEGVLRSKPILLSTKSRKVRKRKGK